MVFFPASPGHPGPQIAVPDYQITIIRKKRSWRHAKEHFYCPRIFWYFDILTGIHRFVPRGEQYFLSRPVSGAGLKVIGACFRLHFRGLPFPDYRVNTDPLPKDSYLHCLKTILTGPHNAVPIPPRMICPGVRNGFEYPGDLARGQCNCITGGWVRKDRERVSFLWMDDYFQAAVPVPGSQEKTAHRFF
jgi:hypothetical protein